MSSAHESSKNVYQQANKLTNNTANTLNVLVVEDDPVDFRRLQRLLSEQHDFDLHLSTSLHESMEAIKTEKFDIVLLDLSLPDSNGLQTVQKVADVVSVPIVVLTGVQDKLLALQAVKQGAQDYLIKDELSKEVLQRTLRYSFERNRRMSALYEARALERQEIELQRLEADSAYKDASQSIDSQPPGNLLKHSYPAIVDRAIQQYSNLLIYTLERRSYPASSINIGKQLNALGYTLGEHKATPRDVIHVHTVSVNQTLEKIAPSRNMLCHSEARYLLAGLLGHLCYFYMRNAVNPSFEKLPDGGVS